MSTGWIAEGIGSVLCMSIPQAAASRNPALSDRHGEALSVPWLQTAARRMVSDGMEKFIPCCATVSSCSLALTGAMLEAAVPS